ncbi:hypothetical protein D9M72_511120 [compost metagenome]
MTVSEASRLTGVSKTVWRDLIQAVTSRSTSSGTSCGRTASPPRRAMVSAMRFPVTAVMFATTSGMEAPVPSSAARSTSSREVTSDREGTRKASE